MDTDIYAQIAIRIIAAQEAIIGPVAIEQAEQVSSLSIDWARHEVSINGDGVAAIDQLIEKYRQLFGQISVEVSKESAASLLAKLSENNLPQALK